LEYVAATVSETVVEPRHLPERILAPLAPSKPDTAPAGAPPGPERRSARLAEELRTVERERIAEALRTTGGVKVRAAELLGMPLRTFTYKCKQYGL